MTAETETAETLYRPACWNFPPNNCSAGNNLVIGLCLTNRVMGKEALLLLLTWHLLHNSIKRSSQSSVLLHNVSVSKMIRVSVDLIWCMVGF